MRKLLIFDSSKCTGCLFCEIKCTFRHTGMFGTSKSMIKIITNEKEMLQAAMVCRHCQSPICMDLCPVNAIIKSEETGLVSIDSEKCMGCGVCLECPLGGISMDDEMGLAQNCDLCNGKPACVKFCPQGALQYVLPGEARRIKTAPIQPV
ncbi:MAG: 4Fe-4S dicluster domain-containing protein [Thermodesulfobacteriota bacterium]|nr:4Fe-4S dicluster domain-containing protein [Thermodesulfobacteriota bacterium]